MERRDCGWSGILTRRGVAVAASALVLGACLVMRVLGAKWYALHGNPDYAVALKLTIPPDQLMTHRVWLGIVGVLSRLRATVPVLPELRRWMVGID